MVFENRQQAGRRLGRALRHLKGRDIVVLGLPRGGVVVAEQVAKYLGVPLGALFVCKISHPYSPEYAVGAMAEGDNPVYSEDDIKSVDQTWLQLEEEAARELIDQRHELYYGYMDASPDIEGKIVILVDDGIATGLSMMAAARNAKDRGAVRIIIASPVAPRASIAKLRSITDDVVILEDTDSFAGSVGAHYKEFEQVDDLRARLLLLEHRKVAK